MAGHRALPSMPATRRGLRHPIVVVLLAVAVLTGAGAAGAADASPLAGPSPGHRTPAAIAPSGPNWDSAPCAVEAPAADRSRVTCGYLTVPERHGVVTDQPRTIRLPVAIIASRSRTPAPDPLVFPTTGGPGGGSIEALWYFLDYADWASAERDIVIVEQRGDRLSEPSLRCPELDPEHFFIDGVQLSGAASRQRYVTQLAACRQRLLDDGVDLAAYTSTESTADLLDLRAALGYDQWNLYGISYGARLSMTAMRDHPDGLRSVILDGVYPPNVNRHELMPAGFVGAIDTVIAHCQADRDCRTRYPDLREELAAVLDRAARTPIPVTIKSPGDRTPVRLDLDDADLAAGLFNALYDANTVRVLPFVIDQVAHGHDQALVPLAQSNLDTQGYNAAGLALSIECAEEVPFNSDEAIQAAKAADPLSAHLTFSDTVHADCDLWAVPPLSGRENEPVTSDIPTLITTGGYDPITPHAFAEAAAAGLSHVFSYDFPTMGHGSVWENWIDRCPASIALQFLHDPTVAPESSCIARMAPTDFLTTADIHPLPAVYRVGVDLVQDRDPVQLGILGALILVLVATLGYGLVYALRRSLRQDGRVPPGTMPAAVTSAGFNLAFVAVLGVIVAQTDELILGFGLPTGAWPVLLLPFVALGAATLLVVMLVRAWVQADGTRRHRIALSISALACLGFAAWLLSRGLLTL